MIKIKKGDHVLSVSKNTYEVMYKRLGYEMVIAKKEEPKKPEGKKPEGKNGDDKKNDKEI